jgi:hypothetical protein
MIYTTVKLEVAATLKNLAQDLKADFSGGSIQFVRNEKDFEINFYPPIRSGTNANMFVIPARFELKTEVGIPHPVFKLRRNNRFNRFIKNVFQQHDFKTGDEQFDKQAHIEITDAEWGNSFFSVPEVTSSITSLFRSGFHSLYSEGGKLVVDLFVRTTDQCPSKENFERVVDDLSILMAKFPHDYVCPLVSEQSGIGLFNYPMKDMAMDLKEANNELLYGNMGEKSKQRAILLVLILVVAFAVTVWRLFMSISITPLTH